MTEEVLAKRAHFIRQLISDDLSSGRRQAVITRFPPEPNGYLHIGHAKSICLNFGMAQEFKGKCNLRFDDTNPMKEEQKYIDSIIEDVHWLGFEWAELTHTSDYYQQLYDFAVYLILEGKAYVDSLSMEEIRSYRGTLTAPGRNSPYRDRSVEENTKLFAQMKAGAFLDGDHVLRAKIDMASPNINMRDPVLYRIRHATHPRTGDDWCIYPMYDYAHSLGDAIENITHSLCTLEFQDHRPLYDWCVENVPLSAKPIQTEFSRLNVSHTITSKRKLRQLVDDGFVEGWDDPRMPTIRGLRHRGYPAEAIRDFCEEVGVSRSDSVIDMTVLEDCVRNVLNKTAPRGMCVFNPLKVVITNLDETEYMCAPWNPQQEMSPARQIPLTREIFIEQEDFMEDPPKKFFRLAPGKEVRLRHSYVIKCEDVEKNEQGDVSVLYCTIDKNTLGKNPEDRKVKGVIHWVSASKNHPVSIIEYDRLFNDENPGRQDDFTPYLNPQSKVETTAICEMALAQQPIDTNFQFERKGYYRVNAVESGVASVWHRIVNLRDSWSNKS